MGPEKVVLYIEMIRSVKVRITIQISLISYDMIGDYTLENLLDQITSPNTELKKEVNICRL